MYDCHPQPLHQLPFDQGVHAHQSGFNPSSVVYVPELIRAILRYLASIEMQMVVMTSSELHQIFSRIHVGADDCGILSA